MGPTPEIEKPVGVPTIRQGQGWLRRFFVREDAVYDHYAAIGQAKSPRAKAFYLLMQLLPPLTACIFINVNSIYQAELRFTGWPCRTLQYACLLAVTCRCHMLVLIVSL